MKQRLSNKEFGSIYGKVPRFCVDVLVQTEDGILITKRDIVPFKGYWHFSGGTVYFRETFKKAVKRIAKEELNLDVELIRSVGEMEFIKFSKLPGQKHSISIAYLVKAKNLDELKLNNQGKDIMLCKNKKDVPKHMVKEHSIFLKKILGELKDE